MKKIAVALTAFFVVSPTAAIAAFPRVTASTGFSSPVGERIVLAVSAEGDGPAWFRFRVRPPLGEFQTIRDFGPETVLAWTAADKEGVYELEVAAQDRTSGDITYATNLLEITPRVTAGQVAVSALEHPLVFLFSAGACPQGSLMSVAFQSGSGLSTLTPAQPCDGITTMNFYLAGLRSGTSYTATHHLQSPRGRIETGAPVTFETDEVDIAMAPNAVLRKAKSNDPYGVLLQAGISQASAATDLEGNLIWYYDEGINFVTRPEPGGRFMGIRENLKAGPEQQIFRMFDLAGITLKETNAARVSEQLAARGMRGITGFHHEARLLPNGKFLVLASTEQFMKDVQGEGEVDVLGDMILVFDSQLQVEWAWDAFDHLDPRRKATLGETCTPSGGGCPPFYLAPLANDWLHGNSVQLTPDGNLLYSARHQDWLIKIAYDHGQGSGAIVWRLGKDGDFQAVSRDDSPWFSHQHDGGFADAEGTLTVFDNGNIREYANPDTRSRGQMWKVDEAARKASLELNADLGVYSFALGSAHKLPEGGYHFNAGWVPGTVPASARSRRWTHPARRYSPSRQSVPPCIAAFA